MKKEHYRLHLPHFHTPGQQFFVTWCLKNAVPSKAFEKYSMELEHLKAKIYSYKSRKTSDESIANVKKEYQSVQRKCSNALNKLLDLQQKPDIDLSGIRSTNIISESIKYWEGKKITNIAFSIMPNHVHWVLETFEKDFEGKPVFLQDILKSVKQFSAKEINKTKNLSGNLWHRESFDVTVRGSIHLSRVIRYTLNNPVKAGFVKHWTHWPGNWCNEDYLDCF